jgi:hypothetical protein
MAIQSVPLIANCKVSSGMECPLQGYWKIENRAASVQDLPISGWNKAPAKGAPVYCHKDSAVKCLGCLGKTSYHKGNNGKENSQIDIYLHKC